MDSLEIIPNLGGYIEHFSVFRGVSKAGKAREKPAKGGFGNVGSPQIGGVLSKRGNEHTRTLNNTEWGPGRVGGGAFFCPPPLEL